MACVRSYESCDKHLQLELTYWSVKVESVSGRRFKRHMARLSWGVFSDNLMLMNEELELPTTPTPKGK